MERYYSTQRPVMPGGYPQRNKAVYVRNFPYRMDCPEIGRKAWGYIVYESPIPEAEASDYELVKA